MKVFNSGPWSAVKASIALLLFGTGLCVALQLPIWCYFISPIIVVFFIVFIRNSDHGRIVKAYAIGDWKTFLAVTEKLCTKSPKDANAHANAAFALANLHRFEEAKHRVEKARTLGGDERQCHLLSAMANCGLRNYEEAIADCTRAIEMNPEDPAPYMIRSLAYTQTYKYDQALHDVDHVISNNPNVRIANVYKAYVFHAMYRFDDARKEYEPIFGTLSHAELPFSLITRSYVQARLGNLDAAISDMERVMETMPCKHEAYLDLAYFHILKGAISDAQRYLDLIEAKDDFTEAYKNMHRARIYLKSNEGAESENAKLALACAKRAVELRPSDMQIRAVHGIALSRNGLQEQALEELSTAVKTDPYCAEAFWARGEVYERLGEIEKAEADNTAAKNLGFIPYL